MKKLFNRQRGFTIVESMVAIAVLVASITGALSAVQTGISSYIFAKDQIIAFYLAQEGFEQLKNIRDENALKNQNWLTGISALSTDPCYFGQSCTVSPIESSVATRCTAPGSCPTIRQDATNGFYGYNAAWGLTKFTREIALTSINSDEIAATVTITWSKGSSSRTFKARENILNWQ